MILFKNTESFSAKLYFFLIGGLIYLITLITLLCTFFTNGSGFILLYTPLFIFLSAAVGLLIWRIKYKNAFETLLIYITYVSVGFAFVFLAPFAVDRSLSTFIFFYAVEYDGFPENAISQDYKDAFFEKRLDDGIKGLFLVKEQGVYKPTYRAKLYTFLLRPLGQAANMMNNYNIFAQEVNSSRIKTTNESKR